MIKIAIADDHQIVIDGLVSLLSDQEDFKIVGTFNNGAQLIEKGISLQPDLILLDIGMPVMDGITASAAIKKTHPEIKLLILTTYTEKRNIRKMLNIGVDGYLLKDSGKEAFLFAIRSIMKGSPYFDPRVTAIMMHQKKQQRTIRESTPLTKREKEIVKLVAEGLNTNEISQRLFLSELTVETHRKNIYIKLGVNNIASLVRYAIEENLLD